MIRLVIFDFDGTLADTRESIEHSITATFNHFQPDKPADPEQLRQLISKGTNLHDTLRALNADLNAYDETEWQKQYYRLYASEGFPLIKAFPGCKELLEVVRRSPGLAAAIVSNKHVDLVGQALKHLGLWRFLPRDLIVGHGTSGASPKPDVGSYTNVIEPALKRVYGIEGLNPEEILVVGDTEADVRFAKNLGAKSCWCKHGYGSSQCAGLAPDFIADSLSDVASLLHPDLH